MPITLEIKAIAPVQLIGTYASSPLVWSVLGSGSKSIDDLGKRPGPIRVGVSRIGSGSQTV